MFHSSKLIESGVIESEFSFEAYKLKLNIYIVIEYTWVLFGISLIVLSTNKSRKNYFNHWK
jgi:hypothetical protein